MNSSIEAIDASCDVPEDGAAPLTSYFAGLLLHWVLMNLKKGDFQE